MSGSIVTRRGDDGTTGLLYGQRVPKDHPRIEAVGAFDELNVALGQVKPLLGPEGRDADLRALLTGLQGRLVALMGEIACSPADAARHASSTFAKLEPADLAGVETAVNALESRGLRLEGWATPGANPRAALLDAARVTARRAERRLQALASIGEPPRALVSQFVNRLSDLLWLLAREAEQ
jgi:cob(I)alamin adenosyltransferase